MKQCDVMRDIIQLDSRLAAIAEFVEENSIAADIGCDHGYLICSLVKTGRVTHGFACDVNPKPLERAKKTIRENCLSNSIDTVLTNGLTDLPYTLIDTFIIAGMGGDTISKILLSHSWTRDRRFNFILQPMTKPEHLRQMIYENGFKIAHERAVISDDKVYSVMNVNYTDRIVDAIPINYYTGLILENSDFASIKYLEKVIRRLEKKGNGISTSRNPESAEKYISLAAEIRRRMKQIGKPKQ